VMRRDARHGQHDVAVRSTSNDYRLPNQDHWKEEVITLWGNVEVTHRCLAAFQPPPGRRPPDESHHHDAEDGSNASSARRCAWMGDRTGMRDGRSSGGNG
jgi:hypothetical protein